MKRTRRGFLGSVLALVGMAAVAPVVKADDGGGYASPVAPTDDPPIDPHSFDAGYAQAIRDAGLATLGEVMAARDNLAPPIWLDEAHNLHVTGSSTFSGNLSTLGTDSITFENVTFYPDTGRLA